MSPQLKTHSALLEERKKTKPQKKKVRQGIEENTSERDDNVDGGERIARQNGRRQQSWIDEKG